MSLLFFWYAGREESEEERGEGRGERGEGRGEEEREKRREEERRGNNLTMTIGLD